MPGRARDPSPLFSVVISTYNRARIVRRCVESCLEQTFDDFEVVVVDDGSTDDTLSTLERLADPRLRVLAHPSNRGMTPARHTGVVNARGTWIVVLDSDWELLPGALARLAELIGTLPAGIRVACYRLLLDGGSVSPTFVPEGPIDYRAKLAWVEAEGGSDAARCVHRSVFERTPYFADRRGMLDWLYELELAKHETALYISDVLGKQHFDAPNSYLRQADRGELTIRLLSEAPDMLWMAETALARHGDVLSELGPSHYRELIRLAGRYAFLLGRRRQGLRYARRGFALHETDGTLWATAVLGMLGRRALISGIVARRQMIRRKSRLRSQSGA